LTVKKNSNTPVGDASPHPPPLDPPLSVRSEVLYLAN